MKALSETLPQAATVAPDKKQSRKRLPLLDQMLREQRDLTAVERFAQRHEDAERPLLEPVYRALLPTRAPRAGEQYAFEVDLDACTGCKACVVGCHSMNGLDESETWRSVGTLRGTDAAELRTVTTACHHCVDPACMKGCPVNAYEKDAETGIVRHLDDQCIGCQYCTFTCPYEVPQFNERLGIVRKCDMCSDRLSAGEAPACVQACPNGAIQIKLVSTEDVVARAEAGEFLPSTPDPIQTLPTTRYRSAQRPTDHLKPVDAHAVHPSHEHPPLVIMLVLTQLSVGMYFSQWLLTDRLTAGVHAALAVVALLVTLMALAASTLHLGRPLYAFRALLGVGRSWVSREILAFGVFSGAAGAHAFVSLRAAGALQPLALSSAQALALQEATALIATLTGLAGVLSSMMLYHVTGRIYWHASRTTTRFGLSTLLLGAAGSTALGSVAALMGSEHITTAAPLVQAGVGAWVALSVLKLAWELSALRHARRRGDSSLKRSAMLLGGALQHTLRRRVICALVGGIALPLLFVLPGATQSPRFAAVSAAIALGFCVAGELLERRMFFTAMASPRMPGDAP